MQYVILAWGEALYSVLELLVATQKTIIKTKYVLNNIRIDKGLRLHSLVLLRLKWIFCDNPTKFKPSQD